MRGTDPLFASNFAELLRWAGHQFGDSPAISSRGSCLTFNDLRARAGGFAAGLRRSGLKPGERCAVFLSDPGDSVAAFFAVLAVGGVGINVNELYRPRQLEYVLNHAQASALITSQDMLRQQPRAIETNARIIHVSELEQRGDFDVLPTASTDPAQVTYTSASTGLPKGVLMGHAALWAGVRIVAEYLGLRQTDRIGSVLPFSFVYGFNQLTTALFTGATLIVERATLATEIVASLRRERVTVLAGVPPLWTQLLGVKSFREEPLGDLRIMTCAGGRLPPATVAELRRAQPQARLFLMYGLTEVFRSTYLPPEEVDAHPDSMGRAIPESMVYVVREDGTIADDGEVGELVHGGPTVGLGYLDDPIATARTYRPNPFRRVGGTDPEIVVYSGDLVRRDAQGLLYYVGRRDRMIKTLGFRVSPDEVSDVVHASGLVRDAAVISQPDSVRGEAIVACIVLSPGASVEQVARFCRMELPRHMQPTQFITRDLIPRNASGKHDILALKEEVIARSVRENAPGS